MNEICDIASRYGIPVVEDAAEAMGAVYDGRYCGTFGQYGIFSFNGNKMITTSGGGALLCHTEEEAQRVKFYATQAREPFPWYQHEQIGYNYRLSNVSAGIGRGQMRVVDNHIVHRRAIHRLYTELLAGLPGITVVEPKKSTMFLPNYWLTTIKVDSNETSFSALQLMQHLAKADIETRFIKSEYTPSVTAAPSNPGLKATWHEFKGNKCSEIEKAPVNGTYPVEDVMIPKKVKGNIGLIIKGYFNAPQDDIYTFALLSDDGSTLTIDSEQIVDNDGPHGPKEIVGQKALAKGYHPMELRYFDQNGGQLKLKVTGSDGKEIPFTHLYAH